MNKLIEGEVTSTVYKLIKDNRYSECIKLLNNLLFLNDESRPALSLLGYCYYQVQDFAKAADCYELLTVLHPGIQAYIVYYAQSLYKANLLDEALTVSFRVDDPKWSPTVLKLQAAIKFGRDDLPGAKHILEQCDFSNDYDTQYNTACVMFKEEKFSESLVKFTEVLTKTGFKSDLLYNIALCQYTLNSFIQALRLIGDVITAAFTEHPELALSVITDEVDSNAAAVRDSSIVESLNLKFAIMYRQQEYDLARLSLSDMPPRSEHELDAVTLHNQALIDVRHQCYVEGSEKLCFLLENAPFPFETFANLLLIYLKNEQYDDVSFLMAEYGHLADKFLSPFERDLFEAVVMRQSAPEEAYSKLDGMVARLTESMRKTAKEVINAKSALNENDMKQKIECYDTALHKYVPVIMQLCKIHWDSMDFGQVEKILLGAGEFCNEEQAWTLNVALVLFKERSYKQASEYYERVIAKNTDHILDVGATVLSNTCVAYMLTGEQEKVNDLITKINEEESEVKSHILCVICLALGTMHCVAGSYEFGIHRIIMSLEPLREKLKPETWHNAKKCFLALLEDLARHLFTMRDSFFNNCVVFLEQCEKYGHTVRLYDANKADLNTPGYQPPGKSTVTYEARYLKYLFLTFA